MIADPVNADPFASLTALRAAHTELLRHHRAVGETPEFVADVERFLVGSWVTGAILAEEDDRSTAQSLIDYWNTTLYRAGTATRSLTLAEFDPLLSPELPESACPYLGLDAFSEASTSLFFGRRRIVTELVERLATQRLVAVVGPSGSGKSSIVRAGLLPVLRRDAIPGSSGWRVLGPIVPGSDPLAALIGVAGWGAALEAASGQPLIPRPQSLLIIDQFEETFTLCSDEAKRREFIARVVAWASDESNGRVVLTMRSDFEPFLARAEALQPLYETGNLTLPPLTASELREAIERPAEQVGLNFEAGLVDALLGDLLGEPAALPLLQYSLLRLWEERERNRVTLAAYKRVGGGRLALARGADAVYESMIPEEQVTAKRILLRLVRPGEGLEVTSNRVRRAELDRGGEDPGRVERVLKKLVQARLLRLTAGERPADHQVEVAHEALVRNWPTLIEWLDDERVALRQRQRMSAAAEQWQRLGRDPGALLAGRLLEEARAYDDLSDMEREFVAASQEVADVRARRATRNSRLIYALAVITTIASLVAIVFAVQAIGGRTEAEMNAAAAQIAGVEARQARATAEVARVEVEKQRVVVDSQRLAFAAQTQFRDNPEVGLLLAYEAHARDANPVTGQTLRDGIDGVPWRPTPLAGHTDVVVSAVFSPDGQTILTASEDQTARLWDASGVPLATLTGHTDWVYSAVFSPDGQTILTASADQTARQYLVRSEDLRRAAACRVGRGLTADEVARFQVPTPLAFDFARRQCPPVYSWQR